MLKQTLALLSLTLSLSVSAATLLFDGSYQLTGATDVNVDGTNYDVAFVDGSCNSLFSGCTDFVFTSSTEALSASQSLLDQVFVGIYDDYSATTAGVENTDFGNIVTLYGAPGLVAIAKNTSGQIDTISLGVLQNINFDSTYNPLGVYAVWSATEVPVPAAAWLLGSALIGLVSIKRKK
ncbi:MAG: hypothetical protein ACJAYG_000893 [Oceanicoccus sp.]|jgi:hypothetical protein